MRRWVPLAVFALVALVTAWGLLRPGDRTVRSALVGRPLPVFATPPLLPGRAGVASGDRGPRIVNVFASWCVPCAAEAPQLLRLKAAGVAIDAIAIRDTPADVRGFLARYGDPYRAIGDDPRSAAQIALGSSGVPESFVVDGRGRIVMQHIGPINATDVEDILAAVRGAR